IVWAYGPAFEPAVAPAQVLLFAAAMHGLCSILNNAMRGLGKPLIPLLAEGLGAVATVVLLFALLPIFEMLGAAYTTLAATAVTAGILIYFFKRYSRHHAS
ncbi:MAG: polysaccharide biosynthesis C-terminal domain-containing protein, partial [Opitutales bacterium]